MYKYINAYTIIGVMTVLVLVLVLVLVILPFTIEWPYSFKKSSTNSPTNHTTTPGTSGTSGTPDTPDTPGDPDYTGDPDDPFDGGDPEEAEQCAGRICGPNPYNNTKSCGECGNCDVDGQCPVSEYQLKEDDTILLLIHDGKCNNASEYDAHGDKIDSDVTAQFGNSYLAGCQRGSGGVGSGVKTFPISVGYEIARGINDDKSVWKVKYVNKELNIIKLENMGICKVGFNFLTGCRSSSNGTVYTSDCNGNDSKCDQWKVIYVGDGNIKLRNQSPRCNNFLTGCDYHNSIKPEGVNTKGLATGRMEYKNIWKVKFVGDSRRSELPNMNSPILF